MEVRLLLWQGSYVLFWMAVILGVYSLGVAVGAILGHAVATAIAVIGGAIASKYISEKSVSYIGGSLFLVFAAATLFGIY
jgi:putative Ca2+/H+ antiporter (TMEM165/GDT1 family)